MRRRRAFLRRRTALRGLVATVDVVVVRRPVMVDVVVVVVIRDGPVNIFPKNEHLNSAIRSWHGILATATNLNA